jgi:hypothetical protein
MKYGRIAGGDRINGAIYRCFEHVTEEDARKFVKKFAEQPHGEPQVMHTFRELVVGAYMASQGLSVRHDPVVDGKTPDWCLQGREAEGLVELVNFHVDKATEELIHREIRENGRAVWWMGPSTDRLYPRLWDKAVAYKEIVVRRGIPYVVAVFAGIELDIEPCEVEKCVSDPESGLFGLYPSLSGVAFVIERSGVYIFTYYPNPGATHPFTLPDGAFDLFVKA